MILSKGLTKLGLVVAAAAIMFTASMSFAGTASAQTPPATVYGKGLKSGDKVEAFVAGKSCGSTTVNAAGEWSISIPTTSACGPTAGAAISFTLNGAAATSTPAAVWQGGGLPPDVANGYVLAAGAAQATATPAGTVVTAPKTGNAGLLGGGNDAASRWLVLGVAIVALGAVAGTRVYAGRKA
jgi:hypothetical protein